MHEGDRQADGVDLVGAPRPQGYDERVQGRALGGETPAAASDRKLAWTVLIRQTASRSIVMVGSPLSKPTHPVERSSAEPRLPSVSVTAWASG